MLDARKPLAAGLAATVFLAASAAQAADVPAAWSGVWDTDFDQKSIDFASIKDGGPGKDGIPSIDSPRFETVQAARDRGLAPEESVMSLEIDGDARAYPLRIMMWHEIVNDTIAGQPIAVTYCPLCNSALAFDRRIDGVGATTFGTTGMLRHSDLVMYDRATESWWQQFTGKAIVGELTGTELDIVPSRMESFERFAERHPDGKVLVPNDPKARQYGRNPYRGYDRSEKPFLYDGTYDGPGSPMDRVVAVGQRAWLLTLVREKGQITADDLRLSWSQGHRSALDAGTVSQGRDIGNVTVERKTAEGWQERGYDLPFAFAFAAFQPDAPIYGTWPPEG